ncbi:hypothetical protein PR202_ga10372 [Eleusine coracana subsp. coracana]|uniref:Uncharacterized protein n=1 Tax=Eleusine coracana subsp. coracana TaxID=191504 RepID=A0AAV5C6J5_ELECO|nr:hypothetical protein PR202_ga10372 [Eleusine coracana subsp. coracana]
MAVVLVGAAKTGLERLRRTDLAGAVVPAMVEQAAPRVATLAKVEDMVAPLDVPPYRLTSPVIAACVARAVS